MANGLGYTHQDPFEKAFTMHYRKKHALFAFATIGLMIGAGFIVAINFRAGPSRGSSLATQAIAQSSTPTQPETIPNWGNITFSSIQLSYLTFRNPALSIPAGDGLTGNTALDSGPYSVNGERLNTPTVTDTSSNMTVQYLDNFTVACTTASGGPNVPGSNYTVEFNTTFLYYTNLNTLTFQDNLHHVTHAYNNTTQVFDFLRDSSDDVYGNGTLYYLVLDNIPSPTGTNNNIPSQYSWYFNMSWAVDYFENTSLKEIVPVNGIYANYTVTFGYNYYVTFNNWTISTASDTSFIIDGDKSSHIVNYTESWILEGSTRFSTDIDNISAGVWWMPNDPGIITKPLFTEIQPNGLTKSFNLTSNGTAWLLSQGSALGHYLFTGDEISISYSVNTTVGFVNMYADRWSRDRLADGTNHRLRFYTLQVLQGSPVYLVPNVKFSIPDISINNTPANSSGTLAPYTFPQTNAIMAGAYYTQSNNPIYNGSVDNGTSIQVSNIQMAAGLEIVGLTYAATYNMTVQVLDTVHNPLPGASIGLSFYNVNYGDLMSFNATIDYPTILSDRSGTVTFYNLPVGNYTVHVYYNGIPEQNRSVTLALLQNATTTVVIITPVPYAPTFLIGWVVVFAVFAVFAIIMLKRRM